MGVKKILSVGTCVHTGMHGAVRMVEEEKREDEDEEKAKEQIMKHVGVTRRKLFACLHSRSAYLRTSDPSSRGGSHAGR